jgi:hypothetical protein
VDAIPSAELMLYGEMQRFPSRCEINGYRSIAKALLAFAAVSADGRVAAWVSVAIDRNPESARASFIFICGPLFTVPRMDEERVGKFPSSA